MNKGTRMGYHSSSTSRSASPDRLHVAQKKATDTLGAVHSSSSDSVDAIEPESGSQDSNGPQVVVSSQKLLAPAMLPATTQQQHPPQQQPAPVAGGVAQLPLLALPVAPGPQQGVAANKACHCPGAAKYAAVGSAVLSVLSMGIALFAAYSDRADDLEDQALKAHMGLAAGISAAGGGVVGAGLGWAYYYFHHKFM